MKLWSRLIALRFLRVFLVLQVGTICIYVSTDLLLKLDFFIVHAGQVWHYYLVHLLPLSLATFPVLAFLSLSFVQSQLRQKREWHLSQQIRSRRGQSLIPYVTLALWLASFWVCGREYFYPKCEPTIEHYRQLMKGTSQQPFLLEEGKNIHILEWNVSSGNLVRRSMVSNELEGEERWSWDSVSQTWHPESQTLKSLPTHITPDWLQAQQGTSEKSLKELLRLEWHGIAKIHDTLKLGERLGLPLLFIFLFVLCTHWIHDMHSTFWSCAWPLVQLTFFAFLMMQWRFSGLSHGSVFGGSVTMLCLCLYVWLGNKVSRMV